MELDRFEKFFQLSNLKYHSSSVISKEPNFTNYAKSAYSDTFIDTLDYVFLSREWDVEAVEELPHRDDVAGMAAQ